MQCLVLMFVHPKVIHGKGKHTLAYYLQHQTKLVPKCENFQNSLYDAASVSKYELKL